MYSPVLLFEHPYFFLLLPRAWSLDIVGLASIMASAVYLNAYYVSGALLSVLHTLSHLLINRFLKIKTFSD